MTVSYKFKCGCVAIREQFDNDVPEFDHLMSAVRLERHRDCMRQHDLTGPMVYVEFGDCICPVGGLYKVPLPNCPFHFPKITEVDERKA